MKRLLILTAALALCGCQHFRPELSFSIPDEMASTYKGAILGNADNGMSMTREFVNPKTGYMDKIIVTIGVKERGDIQLQAMQLLADFAFKAGQASVAPAVPKTPVTVVQ